MLCPTLDRSFLENRAPLGRNGSSGAGRSGKMRTVEWTYALKFFQCTRRCLRRATGSFGRVGLQKHSSTRT